MEPITRTELFLAKAAGQDVPLPEPVTRVEKFLKKIAENSGSGGDSGENYSLITTTEEVSSIEVDLPDLSEHSVFDIIVDVSVPPISGSNNAKSTLKVRGWSNQWVLMSNASNYGLLHLVYHFAGGGCGLVGNGNFAGLEVAGLISKRTQQIYIVDSNAKIILTAPTDIAFPIGTQLGYAVKVYL